MPLLDHRAQLAVIAMIEVALHGNITPLTSKEIGARVGLRQRSLEQVLQTLANAQLLKGLRGHKGGYQLAHPGITLEEVVRAVLKVGDEDLLSRCSELFRRVVGPKFDAAEEAYLQALQKVTVDELSARLRAEVMARLQDTPEGSS
jgi:Rrf2 family protein